MPKDILSSIQSTKGLVQEAFRLLCPRTSAPPADQVEKVVVILGSSRSGSSLLFHLLSASGAFWCAQGEETPFCRLAGLGFANSTAESDALAAPPTPEQISLLRNTLMNDLGRTPAPVSDRYIAQSIARILIQWPDREWDLNEMIFVARTCLDGGVLSWGRFLLALGLDPASYDGFGGETASFSPRFVLEEPPFITQFPRQSPRAELNAPLLLKTSTNVYRIELLHALFPRAEFKYILLTRNPAACINGLMDGWISPAFHSHRVGNFRKLKIAGYTELAPENQDWWKFDLPPGWTNYSCKPLGEVCAFQWSSAYRHALRIQGKKFQLRFEDLMNEESVVLEKLYNFCNVKPLTGLDLSVVGPVMSSQPPGPARWRSRQSEIDPLIHDSSIQEVARELGYNLDSPQDLI